MNTQVAFKIDKKLKDAAMKKARREGTTLSAFLKHATNAFVADDLALGVRHKREQKEKKIDAAIRMYKQEKAEGTLQTATSFDEILNDSEKYA